MFCDGKMITVKRGDMVTSVKALAERWGWSRHKVSDFLNVLEEEHMVGQVRDSRKTLITIQNYDLYQTGGTSQGHLKDITGTSEGHHRDITGTSEGHIKEYKEYKELKKESVREKYGEFQNVLLTSDEYQKLKRDFPNADEAIEYLSAYIAEKGYTSKSHYLALRRWVFNAVAERKAKAPKQKFGEFQKAGTDMDELQKMLTVN
jgi:DNA replication protein DnaD